MKKVVTGLYQDIVENAASKLVELNVPVEGWIKTMRQALDMSGAQLARRMSKGRAAIMKAEKHERSGALTLRSLESAAAAMNCRVVYALVPEKSITDILLKRATEKARQIVESADMHMALESQTLSEKQRKSEKKRLAEELLQTMPSDFWDDA